MVSNIQERLEQICKLVGQYGNTQKSAMPHTQKPTLHLKSQIHNGFSKAVHSQHIISSEPWGMTQHYVGDSHSRKGSKLDERQAVRICIPCLSYLSLSFCSETVKTWSQKHVRMISDIPNLYKRLDNGKNLLFKITNSIVSLELDSSKKVRGFRGDRKWSSTET